MAPDGMSSSLLRRSTAFPLVTPGLVTSMPAFAGHRHGQFLPKAGAVDLLVHLLRIVLRQIDGKLVHCGVDGVQIRHIGNAVVEVAVYGIIAPVTGAQVGVLQPADHKGIPVFLRAGRQPVPDLRLHAGDEQVFAAPAHSAAVVGHQKGLLQHRSKHLFQLVQRPPAGSREQDILSGQLLHKMQKVRRQLTVPVQQGRVHVRRDQTNAVHRAPPVIPCS